MILGVYIALDCITDKQYIANAFRPRQLCGVHQHVHGQDVSGSLPHPGKAESGSVVTVDNDSP